MSNQTKSSRFFYSRLALSNLKKNRQTYIPYIITGICTVMMFYNMCALTFDSATGHGSVSAVMSCGLVVTGIFSAIFLLYTNSFLIKRRKKELGLYNILGMEKKHIGKIMLWESSIVSLVSIIGGLFFGIIFNKLLIALLCRLLAFTVRYTFSFNLIAIGLTVLLFVGIFIASLIKNIVSVQTANPAELLRGGNVGEKEPKTKIVTTIIGLLTLGAGYGIALSIQSPIKAIGFFLIAVILVIIGTYCLFTAGSTALLKALKKRKNYYYKTKHFITVSGMLYRMKQNAVGLANICIMSTAVLVMISTTVSMYVGMDDLMATRYPTDEDITFNYTVENADYAEIEAGKIKNYIDDCGHEYENYSEKSYLTFATIKNDDGYICREVNASGGSESNITMLNFMTAEQYNKLTGCDVKLGKDEILWFSDEPGDDSLSEVRILGKDYQIQKFNGEHIAFGEYKAYIVPVKYVVVSDLKALGEIYNSQLKIYGDQASMMEHSITFDFVEDDETILPFVQNTFYKDLSGNFDYDNCDTFQFDSRETSVEEFYALYGGLFFLGIFLGALFLMATVLIIYYKQIVEGYDDKERFAIMQKVGLSKKEIKGTIRTQILTVFALPIIVAIIHLCFAFPILVKLLLLLNLTNVHLFLICAIITALVFVAIYIVVYVLTAKVYNKIVNSAE